MLKIITAAAVLAIVLSVPASAQEDMAKPFPPACQNDDGMGMTPMDGSAMGHTMNMDEAHAALMQGMDAMNQNMMMGASAPDIDVAFVCSMIAHHQGAIDMAKAELEYGKDDWARAMAQNVIDAQTQEIADMTKWLEDYVK